MLYKAISTIVVVSVLAVGCAAPMGERAPVEDATSDAPAPSGSRPESRPEPAPQPLNSPAVLELAGNARAAMQAGRFDNAAGFLERAIGIEPHNGELWHELARVRFEQGHYEQAMQLAQRSNAAANVSGALERRNEALIEKARRALSY